MKRLQGYKFKLEPKPRHLDYLNQSIGANRFVWNKLLAMNLRRLEDHHPLIWYNEMAWFIKLWKSSDEYGFLKDAPSQSLQQTAKTLDRAFKDAFDKNQPLKRIPRFKKAGRNEASIKYPQGATLDQNNNVVKLPKLGYVKYRNSREVAGDIKNVTITRHAQKYFVSVQTEREVEPPVHPSQTMVGVDMGIVRFATLSDGSFIEPKSTFKQLSNKLATAQRRLKNKTKFSQNWRKQKAKISRLHSKIARIRSDFLHQTSSNISKNHAVIVMEELKVRNMSKSAKGDAENPGQNVAQKSGLNRSILDQDWSEFRRQIGYKLQWLGGELILVNPRHTSQTCTNCGHTSKENRVTQAQFCCVRCGHAENADVVGARNILHRGIEYLRRKHGTVGHTGIACEVNCIGSQQQEPAQYGLHTGGILVL